MGASIIRKGIVSLGLIGAIGLTGIGAAGAATYVEHTRHFTRNEVKAGCESAGGSYAASDVGYGCSKVNANGSIDILTCTKSGCEHIHLDRIQVRSKKGNVVTGTGTVLR